MSYSDDDNLEHLAIRAALVLDNATQELARIIDEIRRRRDESTEGTPDADGSA